MQLGSLFPKTKKGLILLIVFRVPAPSFQTVIKLLDQLIVSRGMLSDSGFRIDLESVDIFIDKDINATRSGRPKKFNKKNGKGYSDHFPVTAVFEYDE